MSPVTILTVSAVLALLLAVVGTAWFVVGIVVAMRDLAACEDADDAAFRKAFVELNWMDFRVALPTSRGPDCRAKKRQRRSAT